MSEQTTSVVLEGAGYRCVRCGTKVGSAELESLPSPRCANCGFTVFAKNRPGVVKQVKAV